MKKGILLLGIISTLSLVACGNNGTKTTYEDFYNKTQEIEDYHYSEATLTVSAYSDITQEGETTKDDRTMTFKYTWNTETNKFAPVEENEFGFEDEISKTVKAIYANHPEESKDSKDLGFEYYINPFKVYVDVTDTIEQRTLRTIESHTYDKYGYLTEYFLQVTASGEYKDQPISGIQKMTYSISYK